MGYFSANTSKKSDKPEYHGWEYTPGSEAEKRRAKEQRAKKNITKLLSMAGVSDQDFAITPQT